MPLSEAKKAYKRAYRLNNLEKCREYDRKYMKEYKPQYKLKNKDKILECDRMWIKNNPDKVQEKKRRWKAKHPFREYENFIIKKYGITYADYEAILVSQNGGCAICGLVPNIGDGLYKADKRLNVDHCHKTNIVRGLLCRACNVMIGLARDNKDILRKATEYLIRTSPAD